MCTEMRQRCWHKKNDRRTEHKPEAMERPFQLLDSAAALSQRKIQWTGRCPVPRSMCRRCTRAHWARSSQDSGGSHGNKCCNWAAEKAFRKKSWRPSGRRTKPPNPADVGVAQASAKASHSRRGGRSRDRQAVPEAARSSQRRRTRHDSSDRMQMPVCGAADWIQIRRESVGRNISLADA